MDSDYIKAVLCSHYRFKKQCGIIATEAGRFNADFLTFKKSKMIEIEIKVSKQDLNADFKKPKHRYYQTARGEWVPHKFYFAVPPELVDYAVSKVVGTHYGVIQIRQARDTKKHVYRDFNQHALERRIKMIEERMSGRVINTGFEENPHPRWSNKPYFVEWEREKYIPWGDRIKVIKRAKDLHTRKLSRKVINTVIKRMSSELAGLRQKQTKDKK